MDIATLEALSETNFLRFKANWNAIIKKFDRPFENDDELSLNKKEMCLTKDNGRLRSSVRKVIGKCQFAVENNQDMFQSFDDTANNEIQESSAADPSTLEKVNHEETCHMTFCEGDSDDEGEAEPSDAETISTSRSENSWSSLDESVEDASSDKSFFESSENDIVTSNRATVAPLQDSTMPCSSPFPALRHVPSVTPKANEIPKFRRVVPVRCSSVVEMPACNIDSAISGDCGDLNKTYSLLHSSFTRLPNVKGREINESHPTKSRLVRSFSTEGLINSLTRSSGIPLFPSSGRSAVVIAESVLSMPVSRSPVSLHAKPINHSEILEQFSRLGRRRLDSAPAKVLPSCGLETSSMNLSQETFLAPPAEFRTPGSLLENNNDRRLKDMNKRDWDRHGDDMFDRERPSIRCCSPTETAQESNRFVSLRAMPPPSCSPVPTRNVVKLQSSNRCVSPLERSSAGDRTPTRVIVKRRQNGREIIGSIQDGWLSNTAAATRRRCSGTSTPTKSNNALLDISFLSSIGDAGHSDTGHRDAVDGFNLDCASAVVSRQPNENCPANRNLESLFVMPSSVTSSMIGPALSRSGVPSVSLSVSGGLQSSRGSKTRVRQNLTIVPRLRDCGMEKTVLQQSPRTKRMWHDLSSSSEGVTSIDRALASACRQVVRNVRSRISSPGSSPEAVYFGGHDSRTNTFSISG